MAKVSEMKRAEAAARQRMATTPRAVSATLAPDGRLQIELSGGLALLVDARDVEGIERATPEDLRQVQISPSGYGLHFPALDADVYLPGLLEGHFGSQAYMATIGARGGQARSAAKAAAARENGRRGGRPAKAAATQ